MIRKSKKKGFTIVELVIVIAVIGVLAAVLIPTFISLNKKAEKAADDSLIQNLNTALRIEEGTEGKNKTCHDAILDVEEYGYKLANLVSKSGKTIVWDQESDEFILDAGEDKNTVRYWEIRSDMPGAENNRSIYAGNNWSVKNVGGEEGITVGFALVQTQLKLKLSITKTSVKVQTPLLSVQTVFSKTLALTLQKQPLTTMVKSVKLISPKSI